MGNRRHACRSQESRTCGNLFPRQRSATGFGSVLSGRVGWGNQPVQARSSNRQDCLGAAVGHSARPIAALSAAATGRRQSQLRFGAAHLPDFGRRRGRGRPVVAHACAGNIVTASTLPKTCPIRGCCGPTSRSTREATRLPAGSIRLRSIAEQSVLLTPRDSNETSLPQSRRRNAAMEERSRQSAVLGGRARRHRRHCRSIERRSTAGERRKSGLARADRHLVARRPWISKRIALSPSAGKRRNGNDRPAARPHGHAVPVSRERASREILSRRTARSSCNPRRPFWAFALRPISSNRWQATLAQHPDDPAGLATRGELRLDRGQTTDGPRRSLSITSPEAGLRHARGFGGRDRAGKPALRLCEQPQRGSCALNR